MGIIVKKGIVLSAHGKVILGEDTRLAVDSQVGREVDTRSTGSSNETDGVPYYVSSSGRRLSPYEQAAIKISGSPATNVVTGETSIYHNPVVIPTRTIPTVTRLTPLTVQDTLQAKPFQERVQVAVIQQKQAGNVPLNVAETLAVNRPTPAREGFNWIDDNSPPSTGFSMLTSKAFVSDVERVVPKTKNKILSRNEAGKLIVNFSNVPKPAKSFVRGFTDTARYGSLPDYRGENKIDKAFSYLGGASTLASFSSGAKALNVLDTTVLSVVPKGAPRLIATLGLAKAEAVGVSKFYQEGLMGRSYTPFQDAAFRSGLASERESKGLLGKGLYSLNIGTSQDTDSFVSGVRGYYESKGLTGLDQDREVALLLNRRLYIEPTRQALVTANAGRFSEIAGRVNLQGTTLSVKNIFSKDVAKKLFVPGAAEGLGELQGNRAGYGSDYPYLNFDKPLQSGLAEDIIIGSASGATAATFGGFIGGSSKLVRKSAEQTGNIMDLSEPVTDVIAGIGGVRVPVSVPSFSFSLSKPVSYSGATAVKGKSVMPTLTPTTSLPLPSIIRPVVPVSVPTFSATRSLVSSRTSIKPISDPFVPSDPFAPVKPMSEVRPMSEVPSNVPSIVRPVVPSFTPTKLSMFPLIPLHRGGGYSFKSNKSLLKQKKAYTPSFTALTLNIKGSKPSKGVITSGLGLRPIISNKRSKGRKRGLFGSTRY